MRACTAEEAAQLLAALRPDDQVPYALAFYAGLRRAEISPLDWRDVDLGGFRLHAQIEIRGRDRPASADRSAPAAEAPGAWLRQGQPARGPVTAVSVMSGKLAIRATKAWKDAPGSLEPITLHECRHTYASFPTTARYTSKADLQRPRQDSNLGPAD